MVSDGTTMSVGVQPGYGWGWTDGAQTIDAPPAFMALVSREPEGWEGSVADGQYAGAQLLMSPRHVSWDGAVNIEIRLADGTSVSGYGEIPIECQK